MFIATPLDKYSRHWTRNKPNPMILQRLALLAAKSLQYVQQGLMSVEETDLKVSETLITHTNPQRYIIALVLNLTVNIWRF